MSDTASFTREVNEHIRLTQRKGGLCFGTDAYLLTAYVRPQPRVRAVDLGSGTGIIPLLCLSRNKAASFIGVELQETYCGLSAENASVNGFADRLTPLCRDVRELTAADVGGEAGLVTANPPYMRAGSGMGNASDEKFLARHEAAGNVTDFCAAAGRILRHGGRFVCVFRPERTAELFASMQASHLEPKRMTAVQATAAAKPSMILVEAVKYASPGLLLTPPLCLWQPDADAPDKPDAGMIPTADQAYIYENCAFPDRFTVR